MMRAASGRGKRMAMPPPLNALGSGNDACVSRAMHQGIDPMRRYAPQTVGVLRTILDGLDPDMPVELESGVPLVATTVADLRALDAWPPDLRLIRPSDPRLPESVVTVERAWRYLQGCRFVTARWCGLHPAVLVGKTHGRDCAGEAADVFDGLTEA